MEGSADGFEVKNADFVFLGRYRPTKNFKLETSMILQKMRNMRELLMVKGKQSVQDQIF